MGLTCRRRFLKYPKGINAIHILQSETGDVQSVFALVLLPGLGSPRVAATDARLSGELDRRPVTRRLTLVIVLNRRSAPVPRNRCHGEVRRGGPSAGMANHAHHSETRSKKRSKKSPMN